MGIFKVLKNLYRGVFNLNTGIERAYAYAHSEPQAKIIMARRIAKKQGVLPVVLMSWMKEHPERYKINIEVEFHKDEAG